MHMQCAKNVVPYFAYSTIQLKIYCISISLTKRNPALTNLRGHAWLALPYWTVHIFKLKRWRIIYSIRGTGQPLYVRGPSWYGILVQFVQSCFYTALKLQIFCAFTQRHRGAIMNLNTVTIAGNNGSCALIVLCAQQTENKTCTDWSWESCFKDVSV